MKRERLKKLLKAHRPFNDSEKAMWETTSAFVHDQPECFERTLAMGHVTASAWVVSPDRAEVLLMHHRKLDKWFQPGGHCDGDSNVAEVAAKELSEETGVQGFRLVSSTIFDVDVHLIPDNPKEKAHYHYDIRFLFEADPAKPLLQNAESKAVRWVPLKEVYLYNSSDSILRMVEKMQVSS